ncbi:MAG: hypothetical protein WBH86_07350 [Thermogutta sp.]|nr:hypothetical protein [Thermogutta sp.]HOP78681.1 hypothetical protein [Thermogutta sp.]HPU06306.1 hypothetical protein [Thermogutta sp.]HQF15073.1 hypothetical protein [Thermogutta sp.]
MRQFLGKWLSVALFFVCLGVCSIQPGCKRTPPEPPALTEEVKSAIQAEDQEIFEQEKAQR